MEFVDTHLSASISQREPASMISAASLPAAPDLRSLSFVHDWRHNADGAEPLLAGGAVNGGIRSPVD